MTEIKKTFDPNVTWDSEVEDYLRAALGDERFERTAAALSRPPRTTCMRVNTLKTSAQEVLSRVQEILGASWGPDVAQVHPLVPCAIILQGSGPHEVSYDAAGGREVIISRKAGEAVLRGAPVFAPGVLAVSSGVARGDLVALAVAREKPGSEIPEVTRGTTLYTSAGGPAASANNNEVADDAVTAITNTTKSPITKSNKNSTATTTTTTTITTNNDPTTASCTMACPPATDGCDPSASARATIAAVNSSHWANACASANLPKMNPYAGAAPSNAAAYEYHPSGSALQASDKGAEGPGIADPPHPQGVPRPPPESTRAGARGAPEVKEPDSATCDPLDSDGDGGVLHGYRGHTRQRPRLHKPQFAEDGASAASDTIPSASAASAPAQAASRPRPPSPPPPPGWTLSSQGRLPPRMGMYVGLARALMSRQEVFRTWKGLTLELVDPVFRVPPVIGGLPSGWIMLQNLPSVVAALALNPSPGSRVLDMCAAPGGKTTLLAQIMGDKGEIVAFDRTHAKVSEITSLAQELGVTCIKAIKMDAGKALERPTGHHGNTATQLQPHHSQPRPQPGPTCAPGTDGDSQDRRGGLVVSTSAAPAAAITTETKAAGLLAAHSSDMCKASTGGNCQEGGATLALQERLDRSGTTESCVGKAVSNGSVVSDKARLREERRRAAMIRRGIMPPEPQPASLPSGPTTYPAESFNHVLLDAPCSALGLRPRLQQQSGALYLRQCAAAQRRLVDTAVRLLRVGGSLVYSTCTINPGENEAIVRYLLDKYGSSFELVPAGPPFLGGPGLVGHHPTMVEVGRRICEHAAAGTTTATTTITAIMNGAEATATTVAAAPMNCAAAVNDPSAPGGAHGVGTKGNGDGCSVTSDAHDDRYPFRGEQWLMEAEAARVQRFDASDASLDTIGFFIAKFVKLKPVMDWLS